MNKRNIKTWKNKNGNLCFSYDMRNSMENSGIIIIVISLIFIGIILFEYLYFNSCHSLMILLFLILFIFTYLTFCLLKDKDNEKVIEYMMDKNVSLRLHNEIKKLGENIYEKKRKFYRETKGTYGIVIGTYMLVLLSNNDILEYELKYHSFKDNQKGGFYEFIKVPRKCSDPKHRKLIEVISFTKKLSAIKLNEGVKLSMIILGILFLGISLFLILFYMYIKLGVVKFVCAFLIYFTIYLLSQIIIHYKNHKILIFIHNILFLPIEFNVLISPAITIFTSYIFLIVYSFFPPRMLVFLLKFLFSMNLSIESTIFIMLSLGSIIATYGEKYIQWIIKRFSPLKNWGNHKYEKLQEELALYVIRKNNIIFLIYFIYLLYLIISNFVQIQYNTPLISIATDNAVLKSFLVFIAFSNMINKSGEVDIESKFLLNKILKLIESHYNRN